MPRKLKMFDQVALNSKCVAKKYRNKVLEWTKEDNANN